MKRILSLFILLLLAGCTAPQIELQEVTNESVVEELPAITDEEITLDTAPYYNFSEGESQEILGHEVTLTKIHINPEVDLLIDGEEGSLIETKNEEIFDDLRVSINYIYDVYQQEKYVTLKIEPLILEENQYIIRKAESITVGTKEVTLDESRADGSIRVTIHDKGTKVGVDEERIIRGETKEIYGLSLTNNKNYYKINQYAIVTLITQ